ncbi:MAG: undecaprenyl-diphosphate phosphatase, partial [Firmicutes bacterium]|nr:undecaprenyl-diphosphate phosphatase [Bacillota bacterium]
MSLIKTIILGVVQGLTEFLPVSSSGHLVICQRLFGLESAGVTLEVLLHFGTLLAVFWVFWR